MISGIVGFFTQYESTFVDSITSVTVFFYIAEALSIISFILMMVGVTKAKKDSDGYKKVYKYIIASLLIQIIGCEMQRLDESIGRTMRAENLTKFFKF